MEKRILRSLSLASILITLVFISSNSSWAAEKYPSRPIELVTGFPPGGAADLMNRSLAKYLSKALGATVVPVNKPGGSGAVATTYVANSRPDGYTILNQGENIFTTVLLEQATYALENLRFVCQFGLVYTVIAVPADSPWKTFQEFIDSVRKNPGAVTYGHAGVGTIPTLRFDNLLKYANLKMVGVPFKGDGEVVPALLGKHVPVAVFTLGAVKPLADAGKLRILFSFDPPAQMDLDPSIPDWKTFFGKDAPEITFSTYLVVAGKTPDEIIHVLERAVEEISKDPEFIREFKSSYQGVQFIDSKTITEKIIPARISRMREIFKDAGLIK